MTPKEFSKANNDGDDVFLCEYEYDIQWHSFKRIADIDDGEEVRAQKKMYIKIILYPYWFNFAVIEVLIYVTGL